MLARCVISCVTLKVDKIYYQPNHLWKGQKAANKTKRTYTAKIPNLKTRKIILFQDFKSCFRIYNLGRIARKLSRQDCDNLENKIYNLENKI